MAKYCKEIVDRICDGIRNGDTQIQAANKVGIAESCFYKWMNEKVEFKEAIKKAKESFEKTIVGKLEKSLWEVALGYDTEETKTEYGKDKHGNPTIVKQTTTKKHIAPSVPALIFALCNKAPEEWKNRQFTEVDGKIKTEEKSEVNLASVPDELLEQVLEHINQK